MTRLDQLAVRRTERARVMPVLQPPLLQPASALFHHLVELSHHSAFDRANSRRAQAALHCVERL